MKHVYRTIFVAILAVCAAITVSAQSDSVEPGILLSEDVFDIMVEVSYSVDGQLVRAKLPAQLLVDTTSVVTSVVAHHDSTVGIFGFEIVETIETDEEFVYSRYGSFDAPSRDNKLIVVSVNVTNLWDETANVWSLSAAGIDQFGNQYDQDHKTCDDLDPGESGQCLLGFEVAEDVNLVALDVSADDHKKFSLPEITE